MTFKWTYISAGLLIVIAIAASVWDAGIWGASSHLWAIGLFAVAAAVIIFARYGRFPTHVERSKQRFAGYPMNQVMAVFDDRDDATSAFRDLRGAGFTHSDLTVYAKESGVIKLDSEGEHHGVTGVAQRSIEHLVTDVDDLKGYQDAVREGGVVLGVLAEQEDRRNRVLNILQRHHGYDVHFFGELAVRRMDIDSRRARVDGAGGGAQGR